MVETRKIQNQEGTPAFNCRCDLCTEWRQVCNVVIPEQLKHQLERVGIQLDAPTELYGFRDGIRDSSVRVMFHLIGKILEGPAHTEYVEHLDANSQKLQMIRKDPYLGLRVLPRSECYQAAPHWKGGNEPGMLVVDFRLSYSPSFQSRG